jgi:hypothetical protein
VLDWRAGDARVVALWGLAALDPSHPGLRRFILLRLNALGYLIGFLVVALLVVSWLIWAAIRPKLYARYVQRAVAEFGRDRKELESTFFREASQSGKPRGLAWTQCAFGDGLLLGRDRANGELVGLVPVTIGFKAVEGGGMEDVEAVGNLRAATAVFTHNGRGWTTQGRAVFNLEPREVLERYRESLVPVAG